jgi:hypothetical protein
MFEAMLMPSCQEYLTAPLCIRGREDKKVAFKRIQGCIPNRGVILNGQETTILKEK